MQMIDQAHHIHFNNTFVLSLAGMELASFRGACMVLCFRYVTKTVLITRQCVSYC